MHQHSNAWPPLLANACALMLLVAPAGCYDGQRLVDEVRNNAIRTRMEEVPIGYFRTTLPRHSIEATGMEVEIDLFGTAVRYKTPEVRQAIQREAYRLRQAILLAIRQITAEEIADPNLTSLRERLFDIVNAELGDTPIESLGIRHVRFIPL